MEYSVKDLSSLSGVSARTLRWYDEIGLLKPCRIGENGYRYYSTREVDRLQQILFYRALNVELAQIKNLLDDPSFDRMAALRSHLSALQAQRKRTDALICAVQRTILAEERKEPLMDREKFETFKQNAIAQNEAKYGKEIRAKYGDAAIDASNQQMMGLSPAEYDEWKTLEDSIRARLEAAVSAGLPPDSAEGRAIAQLHKKWLSYTWPKYSAPAHRGLVQMYTQDERFQRYYDAAVPGCAAFLRDAVLAAF